MKINKLFIAAAAVTMLFASCTKEAGNENGNGGELTGPTYASFSFDLPSPTKAIADYSPDPQAEAAALEKMIGTLDLYILVFNAQTQALEYTAPVTGTTHTALLSAGDKKIFVLANIGAAATANVQANLKSVDPSTLVASATTATYSNLVVGTSTLAEFYKIAFDAGTPQPYDVAKASVARTFSIKPLATLVESGRLGLPMSNSSKNTFTLTANVSEANANSAAGTIPESGTETYNRFKVVLDYMGAKARIVVNPALSDFSNGLAVITNPIYSVKNVAKYTSLVQNAAAGAAKSIYHSMTYGSNLQADFVKHFDQASTVEVDATPTNTKFVYLAENTHANLLRGQSSFFALKVTYKPNFIVQTIGFDNTVNAEKATYTKIDTWDNVKAASALGDGNTTYVYTTEAIGTIPAGTYFASARLLGDAVWMNANRKNISDPSYSSTIGISDAVIATKFKIYKNAESWYRMDIGTGAGASTIYGVLRGNAYTATVNKITGPGETEEKNLFEKPENPVSALTYINVSIVAATWNPQTQSGDL